MHRTTTFLTPLPPPFRRPSLPSITPHAKPHASLHTPSHESFTITPPESGQRLDKLLATRYPHVSRTYLQNLLTTGHVLLDSHPPPKSHKATPGETVHITFITPERDLALTPEDIPLDILHEDEHLIVVNKPAGMVVHPAPGNWRGTLVHALTHRYGDIARMGGPRPGIVHRLDKGTSGVLVVARNLRAHAELMRQFAEREVGKEYLAVTVGNPAGRGCVGRVISTGIGRGDDFVRMKVVEGGKSATSRVEVLGGDERGLLHLVRVRIETGRTHQIRVHMEYCGTPVLGDEIYGVKDVNKRFARVVTRPLLHARGVTVRHPETGVEMRFCAGVPEDMLGFVRRVVVPGFGDYRGGRIWEMMRPLGMSRRWRMREERWEGGRGAGGRWGCVWEGVVRERGEGVEREGVEGIMGEEVGEAPATWRRRWRRTVVGVWALARAWRVMWESSKRARAACCCESWSWRLGCMVDWCGGGGVREGICEVVDVWGGKGGCVGCLRNLIGFCVGYVAIVFVVAAKISRASVGVARQRLACGSTRAFLPLVCVHPLISVGPVGHAKETSL